jgi:hypothetical protein
VEAHSQSVQASTKWLFNQLCNYHEKWGEASSCWNHMPSSRITRTTSNTKRSGLSRNSTYWIPLRQFIIRLRTDYAIVYSSSPNADIKSLLKLWEHYAMQEFSSAHLVGCGDCLLHSLRMLPHQLWKTDSFTTSSISITKLYIKRSWHAPL